MSDAPAGTNAGPESTAGPKVPAEETPVAPPETAPAPVPEQKPSSSDPKPTGALNASNLASTKDIEEPAENAVPESEPPAAPTDDDSEVAAVPPGHNGVAVEKAGFLDRSAGVGVVPGLSRLMNRHAPNYRVDIAILASILSLALAGLWIEWRLPGRRPV